jgi:hypothetical protein
MIYTNSTHADRWSGPSSRGARFAHKLQKQGQLIALPRLEGLLVAVRALSASGGVTPLLLAQLQDTINRRRIGWSPEGRR